jgi:hypothetical protein
MITKELIIQELDRLPEDQLEQVLNFLNLLLNQPQTSPQPSPPRQPHPLSDAERLERLNQLFGSWANQPDLDEIFATQRN